jgi:hypothetical protein
MSRTLAILLACSAITACTPGRIDRVGVDSSYPAQQYQFVPYTKAMKLDVSGRLFGLEQEAFNQSINDAVQAPGVIETDSSPYRVHLAFNGPTSTGQNIACQASGATSAPHGGDVWLVAALCPGNGPALTYLTGSVSDITGPDDPRFRQFMRNAVVRLFPKPTNDDRPERDNCFIPGC